jgi:hypothetical protein
MVLWKRVVRALKTKFAKGVLKRSQLKFAMTAASLDSARIVSFISIVWVFLPSIRPLKFNLSHTLCKPSLNRNFKLKHATPTLANLLTFSVSNARSKFVPSALLSIDGIRVTKWKVLKLYLSLRLII